MRSRASITVDLASRSYPVHVGTGMGEDLATAIADAVGTAKVAVIMDANLGRLYSARLASQMDLAGVRHQIHLIPPGETSKSLGRAAWLHRRLIAQGLDRSSAVVAVGGGVVGDLAGFVASTFLRGVELYQVPTSLLAMVDSAIGGKNGVNLKSAKNSVGTIWQPRSVWVDLDYLQTLPSDEFRHALAEVAKYALAMDAELFDLLSARAADLLGRDQALLARVIRRCIEIKAQVVSQDEFDAGKRAVLNYGHTVGHALEQASGFALPHGDAVALGMRAAAQISARTRRCGPEVPERQHQLLVSLGLPQESPVVSRAAVLRAMTRDKKVRAGRLQWVLLSRIGDVLWEQQVDRDVVVEAVDMVLGR